MQSQQSAPARRLSRQCFNGLLNHIDSVIAEHNYEIEQKRVVRHMLESLVTQGHASMVGLDDELIENMKKQYAVCKNHCCTRTPTVFLNYGLLFVHQGGLNEREHGTDTQDDDDDETEVIEENDDEPSEKKAKTKE